MAFFYPHRFVQNFNEEAGHLRSKKLYTFKSTKSNQWYWVWVECYDHHVYALKFRLKSMRNCENKYSILTNTYEPRRIVMTCINVMLEIYLKDYDKLILHSKNKNLLKKLQDKKCFLEEAKVSMIDSYVNKSY